jgi:hypothetical protein
MEVLVMGGCVRIVMDMSFGIGNCIESVKWQIPTGPWALQSIEFNGEFDEVIYIKN